MIRFELSGCQATLSSRVRPGSRGQPDLRRFSKTRADQAVPSFAPQFCPEIAERFSRRHADGFAGIDWRRGLASGAPLIARALATFECRIARRIAAGDHDILIAEVTHTETRDGGPLVYFTSRYTALAAR